MHSSMLILQSFYECKLRLTQNKLGRFENNATRQISIVNFSTFEFCVLVYWENFNHEVNEQLSNCDICAEQKISFTNEAK